MMAESQAVSRQDNTESNHDQELSGIGDAVSLIRDEQIHNALGLQCSGTE